MNAFPTKSDMDDFNAVVKKMPPDRLLFWKMVCRYDSLVGFLKIFCSTQSTLCWSLGWCPR